MGELIERATPSVQQTWWRINGAQYRTPIEAVTVVDQTATLITVEVKGSTFGPLTQRRKISPDHFPSWSAAHAELTRRCKIAVEIYADDLERARAALAQVQQMSEPEGQNDG